MKAHARARNCVLLIVLILLGAYVSDIDMFKSYFFEVVRGWEAKAE